MPQPAGLLSGLPGKPSAAQRLTGRALPSLSVACWYVDQGITRLLRALGLRADAQRRQTTSRFERTVLALVVAGLCLVLASLGLWMARTDSGAAVLRGPQAFFSQLPFAGIAERSSFTSEAALLAANPSVIAICHPDWHGIRAATYSQGGAVLEVPGIKSPGHQVALIRFLGRVERLRAVVIHGIPPGMPEFAASLKRALPYVHVGFVYHGTPSNIFHEYEAHLLHQIASSAATGATDAVAFVKNGLADVFARMGIRTATLWNAPVQPSTIPFDRRSLRDGKVHVGVLGTGTAAKNLLTQILAACTLPGVVVHTIQQEKTAPRYLDMCTSQVEQHPFMAHDDFVRLVASMDINMYVSLTECFPMAILESLSAGVPCLTSATSKVYAVDEELSQALVVPEFDNPTAIRVQLQYVLARRRELSFRCKGFAPWLLRRAQVSWADFLDVLVSDEAVPKAAALEEVESPEAVAHAVERLSDVADWRVQYAPWVLLPPLKPLALAPEARLPAVAFITYELAPTTPGGAGAVIAGVALDLLAAGHEVVIIARMGHPHVQHWRAYAAQEVGAKAAARLRMVHVETALADPLAAPGAVESPITVSGSTNEFAVNSVDFARAARAAYAERPFDIVEVFDYAGVGYELLRARRAAALRATGGTLSVAIRGGSGNGNGTAAEEEGADADADADAVVAPPGVDPAVAAREYLPPTVPIWVRLHGTLQLIDSWEGRPAGDTPDRRQMHLMEQYALETATALLPQSRAMARYYESVYNLDPGRMLLAPPPMRRMLQSLEVDDTAREPVTLSEVDVAVLDAADRCPPESCRTVLIFGKLQAIKGTETVAQALAALLRMRDAGADGGALSSAGGGGVPAFRAVFMGLDWGCGAPGKSMAACVREIVGPAGMASVDILPGIPRSRVAWMVRTLAPSVAVIASQFETFNMAAHELNYLGVPLVVSDIPAFMESFGGTPGNRHFAAGNATSLAEALLESLTSPRVDMPPIVLAERYPDATEAYRALLPAVAAASSFSRDLSVLETALAAGWGAV